MTIWRAVERVKPRIAVDVDNTVYDASALYTRAIDELGLRPPCRPQDITSWDYFFPIYGDDNTFAIFEKALSPEWVDQRVIYPGAASVIRGLQDTGMEVVFITHNYYPDRIAACVTSWLRENFGGEVKVCVLHSSEPKLSVMRATKVFGAIDDRADFISEVGAVGLFAAAKLHPFNRELLTNPDVRVFEDWDTIPGLLQHYLEG
jgi:hypothetical protein